MPAENPRIFKSLPAIDFLHANEFFDPTGSVRLSLGGLGGQLLRAGAVLAFELLNAGVERASLDSTRTLNLNEDAVLARLRETIGYADFGRQSR